MFLLRCLHKFCSETVGPNDDNELIRASVTDGTLFNCRESLHGQAAIYTTSDILIHWFS